MKDAGYELFDIRKKVYEYVSCNPGTHLRQISRGTGLALSTLRYHLEFLEQHELIEVRKEKNLKLYFKTESMGSRDKDIASLLQQKRFRDIILLIILDPGSTHSDLISKLDMKPPTFSKYISIISESGLIRYEKDGRKKRLFVNDERRVMEMLLSYKRSFWDTMVDNVLEIYFEA